MDGEELGGSSDELGGGGSSSDGMDGMEVDSEGGSGSEGGEVSEGGGVPASPQHHGRCQRPSECGQVLVWS